jgi:hypothetical protein
VLRLLQHFWWAACGLFVDWGRGLICCIVWRFMCELKQQLLLATLTQLKAKIACGGKKGPEG